MFEENLDETRLIKLRASLKSSITRISNAVSTFDVFNNDVEEIMVRKPALETAFHDYVKVQTQLEIIDIEKHENDRDIVENNYYCTLAKLNKVSRLEQRPQQLKPMLAVNLPKIEIEPFRGDYKSWENFKDLYVSIVHNNDSLSNVQKLHYLKSFLRDEPLSIISHLHTNDANYEVAWNLLLKRFDNKLAIINSHLKTLFELKMINKNSATSLREFIANVRQSLGALNALGQPVQFWDAILMYLLLQKLDNNTKKSFEMSQISDELKSVDSLLIFLERHANALEITTDASTFSSKKVTYFTGKIDKTEVSCACCNEKGHVIYKCVKFQNLPVDKRWELVKRKIMCFNCLSTYHTRSKCNSESSCRQCKRKHHTLLHDVQYVLKNVASDARKFSPHKRESRNDEPIISPSASPPLPDQSSQSRINLFSQNKHTQVLLCTAVIKIKTQSGDWINCRALLDSASELSFITLNMVDKLGIKTSCQPVQVSGLAETNTNIKKGVNVTIASRIQKYKCSLNCALLDKITCTLPHELLDTSQWKIPSNIVLADKNFAVPQEIDLLIGAEKFLEILRSGHISLGPGLPSLHKTVFGWIIAGTVITNSSCLSPVALTVTFKQLNDSLTKFWEIESVNKGKFSSLEDSYCEELFQNTTKRNDEGRYTVSLPLDKNKVQTLGNSYEYAKKCFLFLEKRFMRNPVFHNEYAKFIREYIELGHASYIVCKEENSQTEYFIPHHAVIRENNSTTKLRVVFNASAATTSGLSLNHALFKGPTLLQDIIDIMIRFRTYIYAFMTDIQKMYRQILVDSSQRKLQQILWRFSPDEELKVLQLNTITYGTSCAPYLAIRTLHQLVQDDGKQFPLASKAIINDTYMDDIISGSSSLNDARELQLQLIELLKLGGFELHKWCANHFKLLKNLPKGNIEPKAFNRSQEKDFLKTLGIIWDHLSDTLKVAISTDSSKPISFTKRSILSDIAKIFDPLGFVGPVITRAKIIMQNIWQDKSDWDEPVSSHIMNTWKVFYENLSQLSQISIPRCLLENKNISYIDIHGFSDASLKAYGACLYVRVTYSDFSFSIRLICSKSRVAPLKTITLPRLELCGALLLAQLAHRVLESLNLPIENCYLWTDSQIVLAWIHSNPNRYNIFVANRISEIQKLTANAIWNYVKSESNPADYISKGVNPSLLIDLSLWWNGPPWLSLPKNSWPAQSLVISENETVLEQKKVAHTYVQVQENPIFHRFSSFHKLKRVISYIYRFIHNCHSDREKYCGPITLKEINNAQIVIVRLAQSERFAKEITALRSNVSFDFSSKIQCLNPFLDKDGLFRVGGRLKNAPISYDQKYPIILPSKHIVTTLILTEAHLNLLHAGIQSVLAKIRLKFWPLNAKNEIKTIIHKCVICYRYKAAASQQLMGDLPSCRVTPARAFLRVGVDYCGPFDIRLNRLRRSTTTKGYIALFIYLVTKALHLEVVTSLSTDAFLACFKRFISRRGCPQVVYSDNGTNFVGAKHQLHELYKVLNSSKFNVSINDLAISKEINWKFIPPHSPHWGGAWEAGVRSVKHHLRRVVGNSSFTYEEFSTLLVQIEAILNSKPLFALSNDPTDISYLSPAHFIIGDSLIAAPEKAFSAIPDNRLKVFELISKQREHFWKKWSEDYLTQLQNRPKWQKVQPNLKVGDLVILKQDNLPPSSWVLGRIIEVYPGKDKKVRVAQIKTKHGLYTRPITKLILLPITPF